MTIVIARQFGQRIVVLSDTMITDDGGRAHDSIPGMVKAVVVSEKLSIAYAGNYSASLSAIRSAYDLAETGSGVSEIISLLERAAQTADCQFVIASHNPEAELRKITRQGTTLPLLGCCLGDPKFLDLLPGYSDPAGDDEHEPYGCQVERKLFTDFQRLFTSSSKVLPSGIGGVATFLLASPHGHTYCASASAFAWDAVSLSTGSTSAQLEDRASGMTEWRYSIQSPSQRGLGVVSLYLPQAQMGFIYSPLRDDVPVVRKGIDQRTFERSVIDLTSVDAALLVG